MDTAGAKLLRSLQTVKFDVEELRRQEKDLPPADGTSVHATQAAQKGDMHGGCKRAAPLFVCVDCVEHF